MQLRSLERKLACQLAQVKLQPLAEDFVDRWMDANDLGQPHPDMLDLVEAAAEQEIPLLTINVLDQYFRRCERKQEIPDETRLIEAIVHGFAQVRGAYDCKTCKCPARKLLGGYSDYMLDFL